AQTGLLSALADRGDAAARPAVVDLLKNNKDAIVRTAAIAALGKLGNQDDLKFLTELLGSKSVGEKGASHQSLVMLRGDQISPALAKMIAQASPTMQVGLIQVLAARQARESLPTLVETAMGEDKLVRTAAMIALGQLAKPNDLANILPAVLKATAGAERDAAERQIVLITGREKDADQRAASVLKFSATRPAAEQIILLSTVARIGGKAALEAVDAAIVSNDPQQRAAGLQALGKWGDSSVAERLFQLTQQSTNASERALLYKGFVRAGAMRDKLQNDAQRLQRMQQAMQLAQSKAEKTLVIERARTAYDVGALRLAHPYVQQPEFSNVACETIVELAHQRDLRNAHKPEFERALDLVLSVSKDEVVLDRADRYKKGQTWYRPKPGEAKSAAVGKSK
ncbi:MAG: HEAT repeat domain-containing protein, partial [Planctomycetota bacterium]|nr:HEAT repeat domain-containing protein [Planctomycetota bacterium]